MHLRTTAALGSWLAASAVQALYLNGQAKHADPHAAGSFNPQWLPSGGAFWYRRHHEQQQGRFQFMLVNATTGEQRPALDHAALARALGKRGVTVPADDALPIDWIEPVFDGRTVRFRLDDQQSGSSPGGFEFTHGGEGEDGELQPFAGRVNQLDLKPMYAQEPSEDEGGSTAITFVNAMKGPVEVYWIDTEGNAVAYGTVQPGKRFRADTFVGHVWRIEEAGTRRPLAVFKAELAEAIATIDGSAAGRYAAAAAAAPAAETSQEAPAQFGNRRAFIRAYNIWARDPAMGRETQVSRTGTAQNPFRQVVYVAPGGRHAVAWQYAPAQEHIVYRVESSPRDQVQPKLQRQQYLKPGDRVAVDRPRMFDLEAAREIETDGALFANPYAINNLGWSADGREYRFVFNQRGHQVLRVVGMSTSGAVRALVEDTSKTFLDYSGKMYTHVVKGTDDLIWMSERVGWNHLYLFDLKTGELKNQITKGEFVVRSVDRVDDAAKQLWFRAYGLVEGQDHYHAHLARVNYDGTGLTVLTEGDGTHTWTWSPDKSTFTDTFSRVDKAPKSILRDGKTGAAVRTVREETLAARLRGNPVAERFVAPGRDGKTPIYGIIIKPKNLDPSKKYPVIEQIYAGPQDFFVPKAFAELSRQREIASHGFIVVQIDGMGTNFRHKAFHDTCFKNLHDAGFPDRIAWMRAAAESRPWMDVSRVGIYGGSAGGQNAAGAVLFRGDFYTAAAADSGCHDNRMDKLWWNEQWMGYPVDASYARSSNVGAARNLTGALMLLVGEVDTNVDPASTMQVVNALNNAGKDYELFFVPGGGHGVGGRSAYTRRRQDDFFRRHLLGINVPNRNAA